MACSEAARLASRARMVIAEGKDDPDRQAQPVSQPIGPPSGPVLTVTTDQADERAPWSDERDREDPDQPPERHRRQLGGDQVPVAEQHGRADRAQGQRPRSPGRRRTERRGLAVPPATARVTRASDPDRAAGDRQPAARQPGHRRDQVGRRHERRRPRPGPSAASDGGLGGGDRATRFSSESSQMPAPMTTAQAMNSR